MRASRAEKVIFKHNSIEDLEKKLKMFDVNRPKLIIFESVYSMNGKLILIIF
jgi:5-aminolevulinate synthase